MQCLSYCIAKSINLHKLENTANKEVKFKLARHWQVVEIYDLENKSYCYVFANGTVVFWNIKRYHVGRYLQMIHPFCVGLLTKSIFDGFYYAYGDKTTIKPHGYFNLDVMTLESDDSDIKLSLSYGFSQSIKLRHYESMIDVLIERYTPYLAQLSSAGKLKLSREDVRRILANIASVKGELNIKGKFSYIPKFFWMHPSLEDYFVKLEDYMDISARTEMLNTHLSTLNEIFFMLNSYLEGNHSHNLEIIIIVLIAVEIIFSVLNLHI